MTTFGPGNVYFAPVIFLCSLFGLLLLLCGLYFALDRCLARRHKEGLPEELLIEESDESEEEYVPLVMKKKLTKTKAVPKKISIQRSPLVNTFHAFLHLEHSSPRKSISPTSPHASLNQSLLSVNSTSNLSIGEENRSGIQSSAEDFDMQGLGGAGSPVHCISTASSPKRSPLLHRKSTNRSPQQIRKEAFRKSTLHSTVEFHLIHSDISMRLKCVIQGVRKVLHPEYGGPEYLKFKLTLFSKSPSENFKPCKTSSGFVGIRGNAMPLKFQFDAIVPKSLLSKLTLRIKLYGRLSRFFLSRSKGQHLGEVHVELKDVNFSGGEARLWRSLLPKSDQIVQK